MFFVCTDPVYRQTRRIKIKKTSCSCPIKSWKKEKCSVARRGGCRRARSGCANEPQGNRLADAHKEL